MFELKIGGRRTDPRRRLGDARHRKRRRLRRCNAPTGESWICGISVRCAHGTDGCVAHVDSYVTKSGSQIRAIKAMLAALTAHATPTPAPAATPGSAPQAITVADTSDAGADLIWTAMPGQTAYRISRAGADGGFMAVGEATGSGFAGSELTPQTTYRWRAWAVENGVESQAWTDASATTRPTPKPCDRPGTCPIRR